MEKETVIEIIEELTKDIEYLARSAGSWKKKYFDLFAEQDLFVKQKEQEQHLNVGPSYEEMENALLTEQEHNGNLTKEVDRLTDIIKERDAEIAKLREAPSDV